MVNKRKIQEFSGQVAAQFRPDRIILFGSYAYGSPTEDSDVDLLVVMPDGGDPPDSTASRAGIRKNSTADPTVLSSGLDCSGPRRPNMAHSAARLVPKRSCGKGYCHP